MCHEPDSRPPAPPVVGAVDRAGLVELTSADGTTFAAYEAVPAGEPVAQIVLLPDVRGLHPYYQALAERFAQAGLAAVAIDYFGRVAGAGPRDDDFPWADHIRKVSPDDVRLDVAAAVRRLDPGGTGTVLALGFCFGGGNAWRLAASDIGLAGTVGFYGRPSMAQDVVDQLHLPTMMLVAGADHGIPVEESRAFAQQLRQAGKDVEFHEYEGAPHSFFDRTFAEHADACTDAWRQILGFVERLRATHRQTPA